MVVHSVAFTVAGALKFLVIARWGAAGLVAATSAFYLINVVILGAVLLRQLGGDRPDCRRAITRAAAWALGCRNADGGFGHFPGSPSDLDAVYFQVGTLVLAGWLQPADPLPPEKYLNYLFLFTALRSSAPAVNLATLRAAILITAPV